MNVFEHAMQMEKDGQTYYEKQAAGTTSTALKRIWEQLASDEIKHYEIFRRLRDGEIDRAADLVAVGSETLAKAKTIFAELSEKNEKLDFGDDVFKAWDKALDLEIKTEKYYREKESEEKNDKVKKAFAILADEENKHAHLIEHVLEFLNQPKQWLDDAEWSNLDKH